MYYTELKHFIHLLLKYSVQQADQNIENNDQQDIV